MRNKMKILYLLLFIYSFLVTNTLYAQTIPTFERHRYDVSGKTSGLFTGDFNHDGFSDLLRVDNNSNVDIYLGNGDGTFKTPTIITGLNYKYLIVNDFNLDGSDDFVMNGTLFLSNGDGTFRDGVLIEQEGYTAISGDVNGDDISDLVTVVRTTVSGINNYSLKTYFGNGNGTFRAPVIMELPNTNYLQYNNIERYFLNYLGDVTHDYISDLIVTARYKVEYFFESDCYVLHGFNNGKFSPYLVRGTDCFAISVKDFNNDGYMDIFASTAWAAQTLRLLINDNNSSGFFSLEWQYKKEIGASSSFCFSNDLNNDHYPDIFIIIESYPHLLLGKSDGGFNDYQLNEIIPYPIYSVPSDFNNDKYGDFVIAPYDSTYLDVFINKGKTSSVEIEPQPLKFELFQNSPNPFNSSTIIKFYIEKDSFVTANIYNSLGQKVKTLVTAKMKGGINYVKWNGENFSGEKLSSGIYTVALIVSGKVQTKKILFLK